MCAGTWACGGLGRRALASRGVSATEALARIQPENELERRVLADPDLRAGLEWGKPRSGHPEGSVAAHVVDLLAALDSSELSGEHRAQLRFVSIVHDAFKYRVREWLPKTGENHHAMRARRFAERFTDDEAILSTIELHDRPYAIWRRLQRKGSLDQRAWDEMIARVADRELFLLFIELDGSTEGKNPEPIRWFRYELRSRYGVDAVRLGF
jgi:hypothetical protein